MGDLEHKYIQYVFETESFMTEVMVNQDINQRYHVVLQETILFYCMPSVSYTYKF